MGGLVGSIIGSRSVSGRLRSVTVVVISVELFFYLNYTLNRDFIKLVLIMQVLFSIYFILLIYDLMVVIRLFNLFLF